MADGDATRDDYYQALQGYTERLKEVRSDERELRHSVMGSSI